MVVLEGGTMLTIGGTQYLQPDYLSPIPTMLDSKKSPLALLAQTCSQIGADSSTVKPLVSIDKSASGKKSDNTSTSKSPSASKTPKLSGTPQSSTPSATMDNRSAGLAFKPYETNVLTKSDERPKSNQISDYNQNYNTTNLNINDDKIKSARIPSRNKPGSPDDLLNGRSDDTQKSENGVSRSSPNGLSDCKTPSSGSPDGLLQRGATSPQIRSGLEVMSGPSKDLYKSSSSYSAAMNPLAALCCPPGMDGHPNPAFRPPFGAAFSPHHAAMLAAAAAGYPPTSTGPYVSYARVKTPSGGEAIVPVCKDPYCTSCQLSAHNQQMMMGAPCPAGCTQCEHQKYGLAMAMSQLPAGHPYAQLGRPYICNWIAGDSYCGKRCSTSDELLQHLRTHTANMADPAAAAVALAQSQQQAMIHQASLGSLFTASALHRAYQQPPLSPMSAAAAAAAARYHPYSKPGQLPAGLTTSPYATFNPAALNPYYSPYAMYSQRIGSAAHP